MTRSTDMIRSCSVVSGIMAVVIVAFVISDRTVVRGQVTSEELRLQILQLDGNGKIVPCIGAFVEVVRQGSSPYVCRPSIQDLQPIVLAPDGTNPTGNRIVRRGQWVEFAQHPQNSRQPPHFFMIRDGTCSAPTDLTSKLVRMQVQDSTKSLIVYDAFEPEFRVVLFVSDHDESAISDLIGFASIHLRNPGSTEMQVRIRHPRFPEQSSSVQVSIPRTNEVTIPIVVRRWETDGRK